MTSDTLELLGGILLSSADTNLQLEHLMGACGTLCGVGIAIAMLLAILIGLKGGQS